MNAPGRVGGYRRIAFDFLAGAALAHGETICRRWLPDGRLEGHEFIARNPRRVDHRPGSFKINLNTGRWGDFAEGRGGGDLISLAAYLFDLSQRDAARRVADMLGVDPHA